jgi:hypothetical protein
MRSVNPGKEANALPGAPSFDLLSLLLGLAWLGELDREQIARLWFGERSTSTVEKATARSPAARVVCPFQRRRR